MTARITAVAATNIICSNSALLVGRSCKREQCIHICYKILNLHRISHSINIGNRGFHFVINNNTVLNSCFKSRCLCNCSFRRNAYCHYNHIRMNNRCILELNIYTAIGIFKTFYKMRKHKGYSIFTHLGMNKRCHITVKGSHQLFCSFHKCYIHSKITQVFRNLNSDKSASNNDCRFRMIFIYIFLNLQRILNRAQREYFITVSTVKIGFYRFRTG